ncbi:unnamed protein product, partial [Amoebophrya sp. A120]|eukprot:GSA120T00020583001.1
MRPDVVLCQHLTNKARKMLQEKCLGTEKEFAARGNIINLSAVYEDFFYEQVYQASKIVVEAQEHFSAKGMKSGSCLSAKGQEGQTEELYSSEAAVDATPAVVPGLSSITSSAASDIA